MTKETVFVAKELSFAANGVSFAANAITFATKAVLLKEKAAGGRVVVVHRDPAGDVYKTCFTAGGQDSISPIAFPDVVLKVDGLLG